MKIDRNLNLVIPVEVEPEVRDDKGEVTRPARHVHVHASPVSVDVFEENAWLFARALNEALSAGPQMAPRIAASTLRKVAREAFGRDETESAALFAEIRRLAMVVAPTESGYQPVPFDEAVSRGTLDREDAGYVENLVTFFTLSWRVLSKIDRRTMTLGLVVRWGGSSTSLNSTDFARSLTTSTPPGTTLATPPAGTVTEAGRTSSLPS